MAKSINAASARLLSADPSWLMFCPAEGKTPFAPLIGSVPPKAKIVQIIDDGVHINTLDHEVTYEGSRSHLRKIADKERATFEQKLKLDAKKAARTDKKTSKKAGKKKGKKDSDAAKLGDID